MFDFNKKGSAYKAHPPLGTGLGIFPGRVVWMHDKESVNWSDGVSYWWDPVNFNKARIRKMISEALKDLTGTKTPTEAWEMLFSYHNRNKGAGSYKPGEKIAVKVNMNGSGEWSDDRHAKSRMDYTNPVLLYAFLSSLVEDGGVAPECITVYDAARIFPDYMLKMYSEGNLQGINFADRLTVKKDPEALIRWSEEFSDTLNYLPTCVTEADYLINLASLKGHCFGVTLLAKNHFGSFINYRPDRGPEAADLHGFLLSRKMGIYSPLADLLANYELGGKTMLYGFDALICADTEGTTITMENSRWEQPPFNGSWTSSVLFSQDPLALDSVGIDLLMAEPTVSAGGSTLSRTAENYLHEAALCSKAPSGTVYYNGNGSEVYNLGVHEHWNNNQEKLYSRNLGKNEGIELVYKSLS